MTIAILVVAPSVCFGDLLEAAFAREHALSTGMVAAELQITPAGMDFYELPLNSPQDYRLEYEWAFSHGWRVLVQGANTETPSALTFTSTLAQTDDVDWDPRFFTAYSKTDLWQTYRRQIWAYRALADAHMFPLSQGGYWSEGRIRATFSPIEFQLDTFPSLALILKGTGRPAWFYLFHEDFSCGPVSFAVAPASTALPATQEGLEQLAREVFFGGKAEIIYRWSTWHDVPDVPNAQIALVFSATDPKSGKVLWESQLKKDSLRIGGPLPEDGFRSRRNPTLVHSWPDQEHWSEGAKRVFRSVWLSAKHFIFSFR
jgi:hypothetical protein